MVWQPPGHIPGFHAPGTTTPLGWLLAQQRQATEASVRAAADAAAARAAWLETAARQFEATGATCASVPCTALGAGRCRHCQRVFCRAHRSTNPPAHDECGECQERFRQQAADEARTARLAAEAARQAEEERARREQEERIAEHQRQTRLAGKRALARNAIPLGILFVVAAVGQPVLRATGNTQGTILFAYALLAAVLPIACGILAGRAVTRLIVVRKHQAPWKINLDAAFDWRSIWAAIIVIAATGYLTWSPILSAS